MTPRLLASLPTPLSSSRFALLREPDYRRFWLSALLDEASGWLLFAVQSVLLLGLTQQPLSVLLFFALRILPKTVLGLPAGAICDRSGPLPVLRAARLAGALPALLLAAGVLTDNVTVDLLLVSALAIALSQAFERPAHRSLMHGYASGPKLVGGVALLSTASTLAGLSAPLLFMPVAAPNGLLVVLLLQSAIAATAGLILFRNQAPAVATIPTGDSVGKDCWAAVRYVVSTPAIIGLILLLGSPGTLDRLLTFIAPGRAHGEGAAALTLLFLAPATGALIGGSLLAWLGGELRRLLPLALGSSSVAVVSVGLLATTRLFLLSLLLFLLLGAAKAAFSVTVMAALQRRVPDHARGRVMSL
ncbi:MAG: MFS transporter [Dehalococcoidia bacterium]